MSVRETDAVAALPSGARGQVVCGYDPATGGEFIVVAVDTATGTTIYPVSNGGISPEVARSFAAAMLEMVQD